MVSLPFTDGFENDFTPWSTFGSPSISTTYKHHGSKSGQFDIDTGHESAYVDFTTETELYLHAAVRFDILPVDNGDYVRFLHFTDSDWSGAGAVLVLHKTAEGHRLGIEDWNLTWRGQSDPITISADTWYEFELYFKKGVSGKIEGWMEGESEVSWSGDTSGSSDVTRGMVGIRWNTYAETVWVDCVTIDDAYVGKEPVSASKALSSTFDIGETGEGNLSSTMNVVAFFIHDVTCNPTSVQRSGTNTTELRCDWHDSADLAAGAYTCQLWTRGPPPDNDIYGPFTGSNTKEGSKEYNSTYDWDPPDGADLGMYDLKATVSK